MLWQWADLYPSNYYNLGGIFHISANLNPNILRDAYVCLVRSVDGLHSILVKENGEYWLETENDAQYDFRLAEGQYSFEEGLNDARIFGQEKFDLSYQLPMRMRLCQLLDGTWLLSLMFHHICIDGVAMVDVLRMLAEIYDSLVINGTPPVLEVSTLQDCEKALEKQNSRINKEVVLDYWYELLNEQSLDTRLLESPSTDEKDYVYDYIPFEMGIRLNEEISHLSRELGTTPFLITLSAWMLTMQRLSGQDSIFIDTTVNLRPAGLHNMISFFVNNVPLAFRFTEDMTCADMIKSLTLQRKRLRKVQPMSFSEVILALKEKKHATILGNTNVGINYVGWSDALHIPFHQVECKFYQRLDNRSTLELFLEVEPTPDGHARVCYHKTLFHPSYVKSIVQSFKNVLTAFATMPDMSLSEVSLLSQEQQIQLCLDASANVYKLTPVSCSVNEVFQSVALQHPEHTALVYGDKRCTYADLQCQIDDLASRLLHVFQAVAPGEPIGIYTADKMQAVIWIFSILRMGGTYVYLSMDYPVDRLQFIIKDYGIRFILSDREELTSLLSDDIVIISPDKSDVFAAQNLPTVLPDTNAYIISTSGTTGIPKGIPITHRQILHLMQSHIGFKYDQGGVVLQYANLSFDASIWEIFGALLSGRTLVIATEDERFSLPLFIDLMEREAVSIAFIPPILLARLQAEYPDKNLPSLRVLVTGADTTPEKVIRHWQKDRIFINGYGPSECSVYTTYCLMDSTTPANDIGLPILGLSTYVLDHHLHIQPDYVKGELYVGGPQLTSGYINRPELNAAKFIQNPYATEEDKRLGCNTTLYATGDLVMRTSEGHLIFLGRKDNQVKIHGFRIELGEIEMRLNQHPSIARAVVVVNEVGGDRRLVAYVQSCADITVSELRTHLEEHLPYYMIPSAWAFVDSFPMTANGKLDFRNLPAPSIQDSTTGRYVAPVTSEERILASAVASVCAVERVSVDVNLFDLGITSIQVMMIVSEAATFGLDLSASAFYRYRTIREIARHCDSTVCYWYKKEENDKPVAVIVCGDTYFAPDYLPLAEQLAANYSVLVLETYHEYMHRTSLRTWQQIIESYYTILFKALNGHTPQLLCGFCIGGEMALHIASLFSRQGVQPELLLIDSFIQRDRSLPIAIDYPGTTEVINARRKKETDEMLTTQELPLYEGEIHLILASQFTTERLRLNNDMIEVARNQFEENAKEWSQIYPQCSIEWVDAMHWDILKKVRIGN